MTTIWVKCSDQHPRPHACYVVRRGDLVFTATPCYGMHRPWWVPRVPTELGHAETDPIGMLPDDEWQAVMSQEIQGA